MGRGAEAGWGGVTFRPLVCGAGCRVLSGGRGDVSAALIPCTTSLTLLSCRGGRSGCWSVRRGCWCDC